MAASVSQLFAVCKNRLRELISIAAHLPLARMREKEKYTLFETLISAKAALTSSLCCCRI
jgi:hypothetical protein